MLHQDRVHTLRQTHSAVTTLMPLLTAGLTVTSAVLAAFEARAATTAAERAAQGGEYAEHAEAAEAARPRRANRVRPTSLRRFIATLAGRLLLVLLGMALVLAITYAATTTGSVGQAVIITALILFTLYLVEKVARQA